jgi:hypothetical protein
VRSNKSYTNATFTRRVDYEGGLHRGPRAAKEPRVCRHCGAVYAKRRWVSASDRRTTVIGPDAIEAVCPACEKAARGVVQGYLTLGGAFLEAHGADVEALIRNEAARAARDNPLGRILEWDRSKPGTLTITTTTEHLVERLGRALHHAFHGDIDYGFSHANKLARATWRRD